MSGSEEMTAGPVPGVREEVNAFLTREGIPFTGFIHPPIMTVAEGAEMTARNSRVRSEARDSPSQVRRT